MLMSKSDAIKLLETEVYSHEDNFGSVDGFLSHCYNTGNVAEEISRKLGLCPEESFVMGCLHDIGRCFTQDKKKHTFHEIIGARYIEGEGVRLGLSDSQATCDKIAQSIRSHFLVYEQFGMLEYDLWLPGLRDTNPALLLPHSWNELIVTYSNLTNIDGKRVSFEERIADIELRDEITINPRLAVIKKSKARLFALKEDLELALAKGKVDTTKYKIL